MVHHAYKSNPAVYQNPGKERGNPYPIIPGRVCKNNPALPRNIAPRPGRPIANLDAVTAIISNFKGTIVVKCDENEINARELFSCVS